MTRTFLGFFFPLCIVVGPRAAPAFPCFDYDGLVSPPVLIESHTSGACYDVVLDGGRAYVCDGSGGLWIYDVEPPPEFPPFLMATIPAVTETRAVAVNGDFAYVADGTPGVTSRRLRVVDVSNPWPVVRSTLHVGVLGDRAEGSLGVAGSIVYWPAGAVGVRLFDASDPDAPLDAGVCDTPDEATAIAIEGPLACVADGGGIVTLDVSVPASPAVLGALPLSGSAERVFLLNGIAYVAAGAAGLHLVDVSDPAAPLLITSVSAPALTWAADIAVVGDVAYVADWELGTVVIDVSNPAAPVPRGSAPLSSAHAVAADPGIVVRGSHSNPRVAFLSPQCPLTATDAPVLPGDELPVRIAVVPNPVTREGATLRFDRNRDGRQLRVSIHDVAGRRLRTFTAPADPERSLFWDARDASGRFVAPGVYFVRFSVDDRREAVGRAVVTR